jgi:hypothetical protein
MIEITLFSISTSCIAILLVHTDYIYGNSCSSHEYIYMYTFAMGPVHNLQQ